MGSEKDGKLDRHTSICKPVGWQQIRIAKMPVKNTRQSVRAGTGLLLIGPMGSGSGRDPPTQGGGYTTPRGGGGPGEPKI